MAERKHKNWILLALLIIAYGTGAVSSGCSREKSETPGGRTEGRTSPQGPLLDTGTATSVPLDQLGVNTDDPVALASLGDRYFEGSNFLQAIKIYERVIELSPEDVDTYNDLGLAQHYTGSSALAIETLRKGTAVNPSYQRVWLSLGFVLASTGKNDEARPILKKAIDLGPTTPMGQEASRILGLLG